MPGVKCWQVDAFTNQPFGGNPAAICWLEDAADSAWMQFVAAEMNLSETAFVRRLETDLELRWFTPTVEVDLCGHATLATAHALWSANILESTQPLRFQTRSGLLTCTRDGDFIELDFPATPPTDIDLPNGLAEALGAKPIAVGQSRFDLVAVYESAATVRHLKPDFRQLERFPVRGVIITAPADEPGFDFVSRFFAPNVGVDEDPVCGSAHCCLTPYWAARLDKADLMAHQVSARGGVLRLKHRNDRVILGGQAVTVWQGELTSAAGRR
ncbi:PhzF family phenazine biosynthesis isomerase [bacterium]|nr:PhzF family phenazine biosynthesis isomerase [bacterium]